jgi:hypothetical protein
MAAGEGGLRRSRVVAARERNGRRLAENPELAARLARDAGEDVATVVKRHAGADQFAAVLARVR